MTKHTPNPVARADTPFLPVGCRAVKPCRWKNPTKCPDRPRVAAVFNGRWNFTLQCPRLSQSRFQSDRIMIEMQVNLETTLSPRFTVLGQIVYEQHFGR